ncbi:origin recognition complex subunit 5 C-terminus-domain-containing protein [Zychaea mexicana]|uniref:origin recognition complex subunit 5 C-terminus-domain-containing protein n=1 Tax=Zychaea mexicana TaxID=64656 RepID=UPI0022FE2398|nr:origin recognition complex subunit 5 C-terminus-domain-containing protein [Zychaea mexicana]KAI9494954.1 origin recognition complex subunit 5 C-terminus-domain-containing protein [Zychaea mexicana]
MTEKPSVQQELQNQFPGRSKQIASLMGLMGKPHDRVIPSIFIYGHPSSGKTSVVRAIFEKSLKRSQWAYINCVECHTPHMIFEHALNQWCHWTPSVENRFTGICRIQNVHQFVKAVEEGVAVDDNNTVVQFGKEETHYLVLDRAERLRDMGPTLLPVLLRLSELTGRNICVILLSTIVFEKFKVKGGAYEPLYIRFSEYSKEDTLQILQLLFETTDRRIELRRDRNGDEEEEEDNEDNGDESNNDPEPEFVELDDEFFTGFCEVIYTIFNHNCKDINELKYIAALLFPLYIKPIRKRQVQMHEKARLLKHAQPYFAQATDKLYLREISSTEWSRETRRIENMEDAGGDVNMAFLKRPLAREKGEFDLPYYTKFLLLSSYLASYNPARYDVRYFSKMGETRARKKGGGTRKGKADQGGGKMRPQLLGPKAFPVERMLAIFYSIIDDTLEDSIDVQTQITSLTTLRLLVRANNMDRLDGAKFKCNVSFEFIRAVANSVRFEIDKYLYDFN